MPDPSLQDPLEAFRAWFAHAEASKVPLPEAVALATATADGRPSVRMVLFKGTDELGLRFYTNLESRKASELGANPQAAVCFHWMALGRQVRLAGRVEKIGTAASTAYFMRRPRGSRVGAWASPQSQSYEERGELEERVRSVEKRFAGTDVPLPPFWGGYRLIPDDVEFWLERPDRLHDRVRFLRDEDGGWSGARLYP